jgi:Uncharacterised nucleotidyltransferase
MHRRVVESVAVAVAGAGLTSGHELPHEPLSRADFSELLRQCVRHGTLGLLGEVVRRDALQLEPESRAALELQLRAHYAHDLAVEQSLLRVVAELGHSGIDVRVTGPIALARTAYAGVGLRVLDDVHVLVATEDVASATKLVDGLGADDHAVFVHSLPFPRSEVFVPPYRFPLAGFELQALPMPQRLLQLCVSPETPARRGQQVHLRDIAEVVVRERPNLIDVLLLARAWACEAQLATAIVRAWEVLAPSDRPPLVEWASGAGLRVGR